MPLNGIHIRSFGAFSMPSIILRRNLAEAFWFSQTPILKWKSKMEKISMIFQNSFYQKWTFITHPLNSIDPKISRQNSLGGREGLLGFPDFMLPFSLNRLKLCG